MDRLERHADLLLRVGVNLQSGQPLMIAADIAHAPLVRVIAERAWKAGAAGVFTLYGDVYLRQPQVEFAPEEALTNSPPGVIAMLEELVAKRSAFIRIAGDPAPDLLAGADPARVGRAIPVEYLRRWGEAISGRKLAWTIGGYPVEGWARQVFGEPDVERLWQAVDRIVRLDAPDPVAAWTERLGRLERLAAALNQRHFDALHYRGPGTDLTVGLLPSGRWTSAGGFRTAWGQAHVPNLPTEEVFTSPDCRRAEGTIRSTRPLVVAGRVIEGLEFTFKDGRITEVRAASGGDDVIKAMIATDGGAAHLGELALVDEDSRIGESGLIFWNTLYDENAACHIAFGRGFDFCVESEEDLEHGLNRSAVHTDFMVGSPEIDIDGLEKGGAVVPVLRNNQFQSF
jgi:aminopeptidase